METKDESLAEWRESQNIDPRAVQAVTRILRSLAQSAFDRAALTVLIEIRADLELEIHEAMHRTESIRTGLQEGGPDL
jgi:hypothetical protein